MNEIKKIMEEYEQKLREKDPDYDTRKAYREIGARALGYNSYFEYLQATIPELKSHVLKIDFSEENA